MPDIHARDFGASGAKRFLNCLGSVLAVRGIPNTAGVDAAKGTLAHEMCEVRVKNSFCGMPDVRFKQRMRAIRENELYEPEMEHTSQYYAEHIESILLSYPKRPEIMIERRVDYSRYAPGGFGTADCIVITDTDLHIVDYKHGKGVPVDSDHNWQLSLYALGALEEFGVWYPNLEKVILHIVQPRIDNTSTWETTVKELTEWGEGFVKPRTARALQPNAPFTPGVEQCRWCPIKRTCRARANANLTITGNGTPGALLSPEEIGEALNKGRDVAAWYSDLQEYAQELLLDGGKIPGYKLVEGRTSRSWINQTAAFETLRANGIDDAMLYERVPLSAPKLEKALGKKMFNQVADGLVAKTPGKPTMVPSDDKRPEWSRASADFADIGID